MISGADPEIVKGGSGLQDGFIEWRAKHAQTRGVWEHAPQGKQKKIGPLVTSEAT